MWDNPRLLNVAAGAVAGMGAVALAFIALHFAARSTHFAVREIELVTVPSKTTRSEIEAAVRASLQANFFALDLAQVRASVERLPWVRRVQVRRVWPDRLLLSLEEHVALAHWGDDALVDIYGERFRARSDAMLPTFIGPQGSEGELARRYASFARIVEPLGRLERLELSERYAWRLRLAGGLEIMLGRDVEAGEKRLARFMQTYTARIDELLQKAPYVDLRYPNGFALRAQADSG
jgi:cell division protein FtsQ